MSSISSVYSNTKQVVSKQLHLSRHRQNQLASYVMSTRYVKPREFPHCSIHKLYSRKLICPHLAPQINLFARPSYSCCHGAPGIDSLSRNRRQNTINHLRFCLPANCWLVLFLSISGDLDIRQCTIGCRTIFLSFPADSSTLFLAICR